MLCLQYICSPWFSYCSPDIHWQQTSFRLGPPHYHIHTHASRVFFFCVLGWFESKTRSGVHPFAVPLFCFYANNWPDLYPLIATSATFLSFDALNKPCDCFMRFHPYIPLPTKTCYCCRCPFDRMQKFACARFPKRAGIYS